MSNNKDFIKRSLKAKGISQVDLARMLKVSPVSVNDVISGKRRNPRIRAAICLAVGIPEMELWPPVQSKKVSLSTRRKKKSQGQPVVRFDRSRE